MNTPITCPECGHRIEPLRAEVLRYGPLVLRADRMELWVAGERRHLPPNPMRVLAELMRHPDQVCRYDHLLTVCDHWEVEPQIVATEAHKVRKALIGSGVRVSTVKTVGYVLERGEWVAPFADPRKIEAALGMVISGVPVAKAASKLKLWRYTVARAVERAGL